MSCVIHPSPSFGACAPDVGEFRVMSGQISTAQRKSVKFSGYLTTRANLHVNWTCRSNLPLSIFVVLFIACKVVRVHALNYMSRFFGRCFMSYSIPPYGALKIYTVFGYFLCLYLVCVLTWEKRNGELGYLMSISRLPLVLEISMYVWLVELFSWLNLDWLGLVWKTKNSWVISCLYLVCVLTFGRKMANWVVWCLYPVGVLVWQKNG